LIVLLRVDERLIHGQVVLGWGHELHPDRIVVVDDELAGSQWEQDLYLLAVPPGVEAYFADVAEARAHLDEWRTGPHRVLVLTRDIDTMARLAADGALRGEEVNLGGIHHAPGRRAIRPWLYLNEKERAGVALIASSGATVSGRDLPGSRRVRIDELVGSDGAAQ
jgi:mannose/fructose/N-acetylgalactosamine-specific phosphotransferase system component IIB